MRKEDTFSIEQLNVGYGKDPLIREITFSVNPGEILTLIGPNGSGKSTILKTLTGQLKKMGGRVCVGTEEIEKLGRRELAQKLSMVMTERIQSELLTGRDLVASGRYPYTGRFGHLTERDWRKVEEAIRLVKAEEVEEKDFMKISDGQRQRLMLARAICQEPEILILDEPTSYLDMGFKLDILQRIRVLAREKRMAILLSLHELDLAQMLSDRIACVKGDRIDRIGTPEDIFSGEYIQTLYGVEPSKFDPVTGRMFLQTEGKKPEVFVIGGGGNGIAVYRRLQREGRSFAAGILWENDVEYADAQALAAQVIAEKAFYPIGEQRLEQAKKILDQCEECICPSDEFGPLGEANRQLAEYALKTGKRKA